MFMANALRYSQVNVFNNMKPFYMQINTSKDLTAFFETISFLISFIQQIKSILNL